MLGTLSVAKKFSTKNDKGEANGWILELFKEGEKTRSYITACLPGTFKGYHFHLRRRASLICIKGSVRVHLWSYPKGKSNHEVYDLTAMSPERLEVPPLILMGIESTDSDESWVVNYTDPPYDPADKGEQIDIPRDRIDSGKPWIYSH